MRPRFCALGAALIAAVATTGRCDEKPSSAATDKTPLASEGWQLTATLVGHEDAVTSLAFSPDGARLFSSSFDGVVKVWDLIAGRKEVASVMAHESKNHCGVLAVSASGDVLASGTSGEVKIWDARTLQLRTTLAYPSPGYCLAFSHDSKMIAAAGEHDVYVWSMPRGQLSHKIAVGMWPITGVVFSPDERVLYVGGSPDTDKFAAKSGIVRAWGYPTGTKLGEIALPHPVLGIGLSKDGRVLAVGAVALQVFDIARGDNRITFTERFSVLNKQLRAGVVVFQEQFGDVAINPDATIVGGAAASPGPLAAEAGHVALFNLQVGRRIAQLQTARPATEPIQAGDYNIKAVAFSPDGKLVASGGKEGTITLWSTTTKPPSDR